MPRRLTRQPDSTGLGLLLGNRSLVRMLFAILLLYPSTMHAQTAVVLTPAAVDFGSQIVGSTSAVTNITVSNIGSATIAFIGFNVTGDFALHANTCSASLAPQTGCTVSIDFMPTGTGVSNGSFTVHDDAGTQTAALTGTGTVGAADTISPTALTFAQQVVDTTSPTQSVTVTNGGDVALTLLSARIISGDFTLSGGTCTPTLAAHGSCDFAVSFAPGSVGTRNGVLQIVDVQRLQTVTLAGSSVAGPGVTLTPTNLTFPHTGVGVAAAGQTLTLTNHGGLPLQLSATTVTGDFGIVAGSNTCSQMQVVAVGAGCSMSVAFLPVTSGIRSGSVTISSNAPTQTAQLTATGIDFTLQSAGSTSQTIRSGSSAAYSLLLRPALATTDPVTYTCTGAPANARCTVTAQYSDLSAVSTVTVTVLTGTTSAKSIHALLLVPFLLGLPCCTLGRRRRRALAPLVLLTLALGFAQGCGAGRRIADSGDGSANSGSGTATTTSSGTYNLIVSAAAAGVTHTVPLILVVQ